MKDLLAPFLTKNNVWVDYGEAVDEWFSDNLQLDTAVEQLKSVRTPFGTPKPGSLGPVQAKGRSLAVLACDMLGFSLHYPDLFTEQEYARLGFALAANRLDPIFVLEFTTNSRYKVVPLFTNDYVHFLPETDPHRGLMVNDGGDWYATTHVIFEYGERLAGADLSAVADLFFAVFGANLVLWATQLNLDAVIEANVKVSCAVEIFY